MTGSPGYFNDWYPEPKGYGDLPTSLPNGTKLMGDVYQAEDKKKWKPRLYNIRRKSGRVPLCAWFPCVVATDSSSPALWPQSVVPLRCGH